MGIDTFIMPQDKKKRKGYKQKGFDSGNGRGSLIAGQYLRPLPGKKDMYTTRNGDTFSDPKGIIVLDKQGRVMDVDYIHKGGKITGSR